MEGELTHLNRQGEARMVDVSQKPATAREARAKGRVRMRPETLARLREGALPKGDVLAVARVAGILAAKQVDRLIPLCHALPLSSVSIQFTFDEAASAVEIEAHASTVGPTGVEMEALTAVALASLTIYDMCKAIDRAMTIDAIRLTAKSGGESGDFRRD